MKNMYKIPFILLLLLPSISHAQVEVYDFERFKPLLNVSNDTTYVINFWATWCVPCVKELPDFEKIHAKYKDDKFKMLLVSLDFRRNLEDRLIPFIAKNDLQAEVIMLHEPDANAWIPQVDPHWSGAIPATLIYNRSKDFKSFHEGSYTYDELNSIIKPLIKK